MCAISKYFYLKGGTFCGALKANYQNICEVRDFVGNVLVKRQLSPSEELLRDEFCNRKMLKFIYDRCLLHSYINVQIFVKCRSINIRGPGQIIESGGKLEANNEICWWWAHLKGLKINDFIAIEMEYNDYPLKACYNVVACGRKVLYFIAIIALLESKSSL